MSIARPFVERRVAPAAAVIASLTALAPTARAHLGSGSRTDSPPGLVRVEGGATLIGSTVEFAKAKGLENERNFVNVVCETPQHTRMVDDFYLMVSEVTNEQYEAFVRATGHRAPSSWATHAIDAARDVYEAERVRAKAAGSSPSEWPEFDRTAWWERNWRTAAWEVPHDGATRPVVSVSYADVVAYARWAGLRPMTEFEFQRAGRGKTDDLFSWGDEPDPTRAATVELVVDGKKVQPDQPFPVGSFARGATARGIHDLCGNAWEWTSSPFTAYPGYRDLQIEVGAGKQRHKLDGLTAWSAERRVVVGGCFYNDLFTARLATRRPADVAQTTDSLGFRCASSIAPGLDVANFVLENDWPESARPKGVRFDAGKLLTADHWSWVPGNARTRAIDQPGKSGDLALPNYAVITGYDYLVYIPTVELDVVSVQTLVELARKSGPVYLGLLATTKDVLQPPLKAGAYLVAFEATTTDPARVPEGYEVTPGHFAYFDLAGDRVATMNGPVPSFARPSEPTLQLVAGTRTTQNFVNGKSEEPSEQPTTTATLNVSSWVQIANRGLAYSLQLVFARNDVTDEWRHP